MTLDRTNRRLTAVVLLLVAVGIATLLAAGGSERAPREVTPFAVAMAGLLVAVMTLAWAMAPRAVELTGRELRVLRRAWRPLVVPLDEVTGVDEDPFDPGAMPIRLCGAGGFFGSYGLFWARGFGRFRLYATRGGAALVIRRRDRLPIVVTADEPERLREAIAIWQSKPESLPF